jgi:hypothetical protein
MELSEGSFGVDYVDEAFACSEVILKCVNDLANMNMVVITLGFDSYVDVDLWDNLWFREFIINVKNNVDDFFEYYIDTDHLQRLGKLTYSDGKISFPIFDYGKLYDKACFYVKPHHIQRLEEIYKKIRNYKN